MDKFLYRQGIKRTLQSDRMIDGVTTGCIGNILYPQPERWDSFNHMYLLLRLARDLPSILTQANSRNNSITATVQMARLSPAAVNPDMPAATIDIMWPQPYCAGMRRSSPVATMPSPSARSPAPEAADPDETRCWSHAHYNIYLVGRRRTHHLHFRGHGCCWWRAVTVNGSFTDDTACQQERGADN